MKSPSSPSQKTSNYHFSLRKKCVFYFLIFLFGLFFLSISSIFYAFSVKSNPKKTGTATQTQLKKSDPANTLNRRNEGERKTQPLSRTSVNRLRELARETDTNRTHTDAFTYVTHIHTGARVRTQQAHILLRSRAKPSEYGGGLFSFFPLPADALSTPAPIPPPRRPPAH